MRTSVIINDELLKEAMEITKLKEKTAVIHEGLRALIRYHAFQNLVLLGGTEKAAKKIPRRRTK
jgi:Arc/MetJ family transcription regulator